MTTPILDTLSEQRAFSIYIPDISLDVAQKNQPYVLRISVPHEFSFLEVLQIASPLAGIGVLAGNAQVAYAFLTDPSAQERRNFYVTSVFSERPFPWQTLGFTNTPARCSPIGITTHSGVPLLHVRVDVDQSKYEAFEAELLEFGYLIVSAKPYTTAQGLIDLYKAESEKGTLGSPVNPSAVGS